MLPLVLGNMVKGERDTEVGIEVVSRLSIVLQYFSMKFRVGYERDLSSKGSCWTIDAIFSIPLLL